MPSTVSDELPEQRILEASMRPGSEGAVTGWAALRLHGGGYFDGLVAGARMPVPLVAGLRRITSEPGSTVIRARLASDEVVVRHGIRCTTVERAVVDEIRRLGDLREGVVVLDMAAAAELTSVARVGAFLRTRTGHRDVVLARRAVALAVDDSRSPMESRLRLVWVLDAGWAAPLCNRPVFALDGRRLGIPDLIDPVAGLVAEYDGADHRSRTRHRIDVRREDAFRRAGLEYVAVVGADMADRRLVVARLSAARERCGVLPRRWTLELPGGRREMTLDEWLDRRDALRRLAETGE